MQSTMKLKKVTNSTPTAHHKESRERRKCGAVVDAVFVYYNDAVVGAAVVASEGVVGEGGSGSLEGPRRAISASSASCQLHRHKYRRFDWRIYKVRENQNI